MSSSLGHLRLTDHRFVVPVDHDRPDGERITLVAREVSSARPNATDLPWLLNLNGGPGHGGPRPLDAEAWLVRATEDYRVLLLDQRGTGRSTPATRQSLAARGDARTQAEYLSHFRADSIVRDAEHIRREYLGGAPWSVLGSSFGGFCAMTYLSLAPEGLREVMVSCGLPGLHADADTVYRAAYPRVERANAAHYARHPGDVEAARRIAAHLRDHETTLLPNGMPLTGEAFQALGIILGFASGSQQLHYLLENAFVPGRRGLPELADAFLEDVQAVLSFAARPLYAVLHEAIYAQQAATGWAAQRVRAEYPAFDLDQALDGDEPVLFTGEMIYPWMFRHDLALRPLREAADRLAAKSDWPCLYDTARLAHNDVPVAALVHLDDLYVDAGHSLETASAVGGLRTWVTNEFHHDALRAGGRRVLDRLVGMVRDEV